MSRPDIIILTQTRVEQRDHDRFGVEILSRAGSRVRFWSLAKVFNLAYFKGYQVETPRGAAETTYFENTEEACLAAASISRSTVIILGMHVDPRLGRFFRLAVEQGASIVVLALNLLPSPADAPDVLGLFARLRILGTKVQRVSLSGIVSQLGQRFRKAGQAMPPPKLILTGGSRGMRLALPQIGAGTEVVKAHALDYDLYLQAVRQGPVTVTKTAVFLDDAVINHPEFLIFGHSKVSHDRYYAAMRRLFDRIEERYGLEVVIAAHPRVDYSKTPECFGRRSIEYNKSLELTRQAQLVISQCSTSINFAVLCRKPILITTTAEVYRRYAPLILTMAGLLKVPLVRADRRSLRELPAVVEIDQAAYAAYQNGYIKEEDSPDKPFWEIVADRLATLK